MIKSAFNDNKKLFIKFIISLVLSVFLTVTLFSVTAHAASNDALTSQTISSEAGAGDDGLSDDESSVLQQLIGVDGSKSLEIILLVTLLSLAPSILIMMTCFARIIIVFSFLRSAMQTQSNPPNQVLTGLALFLTIFVMFPVFSQINEVAYQPYSAGEITAQEAMAKAGEPLKTFMLKQTTNSDMEFFLDLADKTIDKSNDAEDAANGQTEEEITMANYQEQLGFEVVIPAFIVSELKRAFQMGFLLFIPFLVIDLVVSSTLMAMGMMMLPPAMISMPFKIMLFILVDGWKLVIGSLVSSYNM